VGADPPEIRGRLALSGAFLPYGRIERQESDGPTGVMTTACLKEETMGNTGSPDGANA